MRLAKTFGLVALAIMAFTAFVGVGSASAHPLIGLCLEDELLLCIEDNWIDPTSGVLLGNQINPPGILKGNLEEKCNKSKTVTEVLGMTKEVTKLIGHITELSFGECAPCETITTNAPYLAEISMTELGDNESWYLLTGGNAKFSKCPFGVTCKFGSTKLENAAGEAPKFKLVENEKTKELLEVLDTNSVILSLEEGSKLICGTSGTWESEYTLSWTLLDEEDNVIGEDDVFPTLLLEGEGYVF